MTSTPANTSLHNKTILVTGASGGIGSAITAALTARGATVIAACRHPEALPQSPLIRPLKLDLSSFQAVRQAAAELSGVTLHAIINNAGIMPVRQTVMTADSLERTYQVNYAATRLLTELLAPQVEQGGVIVFTSSVARKVAWTTTEAAERAARAANPWSRFVAYGRTKRLLCKLAAEMAPAMVLRGVRVNCATPGVVDTGLIRLGWKWVDSLSDKIFRPVISTPAQGAKAALHAMESPLTSTLFSQRGVLKSLKERAL